MDFCIVLEFFIPHYNGGGEHRCYEIAKRLVERGHNVDVLTMKIAGDKTIENIDGINVHHIGPKVKNIPFRTYSNFIRYFFSVGHWLLTHKYDIIDTQCYSPLLSTSLFSRITKTPLIATIHDTSNNNKDQWLQSAYVANLMEKILVNLKFDKIITVSNATKYSLVNFYGVKENIIEILYNGVDIKKYDSINVKHSNDNQIIFVGRLAPHKHVDHFIKILYEIKDSFSNIHLVIVGKGSEKEKLKMQVKEYGLEKFVTFKEDLTDEELIKELKKSEILILPSTREGFGMVLAEANCCYKPVITYSSGGTVEVVENEHNGFLIDANDIETFKNRTIELLKDKNLQKQMGLNGRKKVENYFDWEKIVDEYITIANNTIISKK